MPDYILVTRLNINGRRINCKVTGAPASAHDGAPYILDIKGGPGQGISTTLPDFFAQHADETPAPHWILFDALGCGESDLAENPDEEYSVENFTHIAASVAEEVANQLQLPKMNLRIVGGSFGGTIALNIPRHKQEWTHPDSRIQLQAIFAYIAPIGWKDCMSKDFLAVHYANDPRLPQFQRALDRLYAGDLQDRHDFIANLLAPIAPTYGDNYNTLFMRTCLSILKKYPNALFGFLTTLKHIKPFATFAERQFDFLYRFSFHVTNYIFKNHFHGFELEDKFKENPELRDVYNKIIVFTAYGSTDLCTAGANSLNRLQALLPEMGSFLHPGKHHDRYDSIKPILQSFFSGDIQQFEAAIRDNTSDNDLVTIPPSFRERFIACYQEKTVPSSTSTVLSALDDGVKHDARPSIQNDNLQSGPAILQQAESLSATPVNTNFINSTPRLC